MVRSTLVLPDSRLSSSPALPGSGALGCDVPLPELGCNAEMGPAPPPSSQVAGDGGGGGERHGERLT